MSKWTPDDFDAPARVAIDHMVRLQKKAQNREPITVEDIKVLIADVTNAYEGVLEKEDEGKKTSTSSGRTITIPITHCASTMDG